MFELFKKWFGDTSFKDDDIVSVIWAVKEDEAMANMLESILSLPLEQRNAKLAAIIQNAKSGGADEDFVAALEQMMNDEVAQKALFALKAKE